MAETGNAPNNVEIILNKKKYSITLVKDKADSHRTTTVGFYSGGQRLGSTPNPAQAHGNLLPRSRVGVSEWKITKRKRQGTEDSG